MAGDAERTAALIDRIEEALAAAELPPLSWYDVLYARSAGPRVSGRLRYRRTWTRHGGIWRVVAAHISPATD